MDNKRILQKIIQEQGNCSWVEHYPDHYVCENCPLAKLATSRGQYLSCYEMIVNKIGLTQKAQDILYKKAAEEALFNITLDEIIQEDRHEVPREF